MDVQVFDLFPLSVLKDKILLSVNERQQIINHIFESEKETENINKRKNDAWLGDTKGHEFLLKNPKMKTLARLIAEKIKAYTEMLSIDNDKLCFFYQRSWATVSRKNEYIK